MTTLGEHGYLTWLSDSQYRASHSPFAPWATLESGDTNDDWWYLARFFSALYVDNADLIDRRWLQLSRKVFGEQVLSSPTLSNTIWSSVLDRCSSGERFGFELWIGMTANAATSANIDVASLSFQAHALAGAAAAWPRRFFEALRFLSERVWTPAAAQRLSELAGHLNPAMDALAPAWIEYLRCGLPSDDSRLAKLQHSLSLVDLTPSAEAPPPGSEAHLSLLFRTRVRRDIGFELFNSGHFAAAKEALESAWNDLSRYGLPSSSAAPSHDLAGLDLEAAACAHDLLLIEIESNEFLDRGVSLAHKRAQRVRNGRYSTLFTATVDSLYDAAEIALRGQLSEGLGTCQHMWRRGIGLRSSFLLKQSLDRSAEIKLAMASQEHDPSHRYILATNALRDATSAGSLRMVDKTCEFLANSTGVDISFLGTGPRNRPVEEVAILTQIGQLAHLLSDVDVFQASHSTFAAISTGHLSFLSQADIQRRAISAGAALVLTGLGLADEANGADLVERYVDALTAAVQSGSSRLLLDAVTEGTKPLLRLAPSFVTPGLLRALRTLAIGISTATDGRWEYLHGVVRVLIEIGMRSDGAHDDLKGEAVALLSVIPASSQPARRPNRDPNAMLAAHYRHLLDPTATAAPHAIVLTAIADIERMITEPSQQSWPLQVHLLIALATEQEVRKKLLAALLRLMEKETTIGPLRIEIAEASAEELRATDMPRVDAAVLEAAAPTMLNGIFTLLEVSPGTAPFASAANGFGETTRERLIAAYLHLAVFWTVAVTRESDQHASAVSRLCRIALTKWEDKEPQIRRAAIWALSFFLSNPSLNESDREDFYLPIVSSLLSRDDENAASALSGVRAAREAGYSFPAIRDFREWLDRILTYELSTRSRTRRVEAALLRGAASDLALVRATEAKLSEGEWREVRVRSRSV